MPLLCGRVYCRVQRVELQRYADGGCQIYRRWTVVREGGDITWGNSHETGRGSA